MVFHPSRKIYIHNLKKYGVKHGGSLDIKQEKHFENNLVAQNSFVPQNIKYKTDNSSSGNQIGLVSDFNYKNAI